MNIIFISTGEYPDQHAAAIRHSTLAQGFVENGHNTHFFVLSPQKWHTCQTIYKGVEFRTFASYSGNNRLIKAFQFIRSINILRKAILRIQKEIKIDGIIVFTINPLIINILLSLSNKYGINIYHERTELPYVVGKHDSFLGNRIFNYYIKNQIPKFDGIFVISDKLKAYMGQFNQNIEKILTVVDTAFFSRINENPFDFPYIAYCGTMSGSKDGLPILIKAFYMLSQKYPNYKLLLIGNNDDGSALHDLYESINVLGIREKVIFSGLIGREEMPNLLGHASLLVVAKPDNEQNSGNFPIKIGEYLATGVPVVVTTVGEIPQFIKDGETGFLATPNSPESFFQKMDEALSDYDRAMAIGIKGREIARNVFNYRIQAMTMADYIYLKQ